MEDVLQGAYEITKNPRSNSRIFYLEPVAEEQELILDCVHPVNPIVDTWACGELVWDALFQKLVVKIAVHLIEEIF